MRRCGKVLKAIFNITPEVKMISVVANQFRHKKLQCAKSLAAMCNVITDGNDVRSGHSCALPREEALCKSYMNDVYRPHRR